MVFEQDAVFQHLVLAFALALGFSNFTQDIPASTIFMSEYLLVAIEYSKRAVQVSASFQVMRNS